MMNKGQIINGLLPWDGSHLGNYSNRIIRAQYINNGVRYTELALELGDIYCIIKKTKESIECIIDEIKKVFGINKRGTHRICIGRTEYLIYYVPITGDEKIMFEIPLSKISSNDRYDEDFIKEIRKTIVFCEILGLSSTTERFIRLRMRGQKPYPINWNSKIINTKESVIPKVLYKKWFEGSTSVVEVLREMIGYSETRKNLCEITMDIRNKIDGIVRIYDKSYIWYSNMIIERISEYILSEGDV